MATFAPRVLPEEAPPLHAIDCRLCELSAQRHRVIWGEGNPEAPIFIVLDNPGAREDKEGNPFVCGTRETLQQGLHETGIPADLVYVTYLLKCRPRRAYNKPLARKICSQHLFYQLEGRRPSLLLCLGNVVVQALLGDEEADVKQLRGRWHDVQGIPAAVSYHPLAVRRRPGLMPMFLEDLRFLKERAVSFE